MKFSAIPSALTVALLSATAAQAETTTTDFYGSLRMGIDDVSAKDNGDAGGLNGRDYLSRIGVKANTDLGSGLTGVGVVEYGIRDSSAIDISQNGQPTLRLAYVGLKGGFGEIYYGSQTPIFHTYVRSAYFSDGSDTVRLGTVRDDDLTQYFYKAENFSVAAAVQTETQDGDDFDSWSLAGDYKAGPFKVQVAYVKDERVGDGDLMGARVWFDATSAVKLSAFYHLQSEDYGLTNGSTGNVRLQDKTEAGVNNCAGEERSNAGVYGSFKTGANQIHARYAIDSCDDAGDVDSIKVEYIRYLAKNYRVWVSYETLDADDSREPASGDLSETQLGVRYDF